MTYLLFREGCEIVHNDSVNISLVLCLDPTMSLHTVRYLTRSRSDLGLGPDRRVEPGSVHPGETSKQTPPPLPI